MTSSKRLRLAEALLAKAQATGFEPERDAFVSGAFDQLSAYMGGGTPKVVTSKVDSSWRLAATYRPARTSGLLVDCAL